MTGYTKDHAWVRMDGETATVGISDYAQRQLGDIVYVDLPKVGAALTQGETMGTVESVKSVSELVAPVSGVVTEVNGALTDAAELLNQDPEGEAWLVRVKLAGKVEGLMDAAAYRSYSGVVVSDTE